MYVVVTLLYRMMLGLLGVVLLASCSALAPQIQRELTQLPDGQFQLDPAHTSVVFEIEHMQLSTFVGRFNDVQASLDFTPQQIEQTRLTAVVKMPSIDVNNTALEETLRSDSWFDTTVYPEAVYKTISVSEVDDRHYLFKGQLTLMGVTRPLSLLVQFHGGADNWLTGYYTIGFSATARFKRSDFGIDQYIPMVGDLVELRIHGEFQQRK